MCAGPQGYVTFVKSLKTVYSFVPLLFKASGGFWDW